MTQITINKKTLVEKIINDSHFSEGAAKAIVANLPIKDIHEILAKYIGENYIEDDYNEVTDSFANSTTSLDDTWHEAIETDGFDSIVYKAT